MFADPRGRIAAIEDELDDLAAAAENCRKFVLVGRVGALAGLVALLLAAWRGEVFLFIAGVAAGLGGLVLAGSTGSTRAEILKQMSEREDERAALIASLPMTPVARE